MNPARPQTARDRSGEFLKISGQFKLGALVTESSHPVTARLSEVAQRDIAAALDLLSQVDADVVARYREFAASGRAAQLRDAVLQSLRSGGRLFFTGCGATGRLSIQLVSIWRDFWRQTARGPGGCDAAANWEDRAFSVMAGGDYALIKSVEGFEDFAAFGEQQLADLGVSGCDVVFAITEGGETSFVIGTAWKGVAAGAKVFFVYNNPDDVLVRHVERSRKVIADPRIEKLNLTTGPMAITGSTRMQATTIQLCVLLTVLEMVVQELLDLPEPVGTGAADIGSAGVPARFLEALGELHATLRSPEASSALAGLVALEESVYRSGHKNNYYASRFGLDVLTDTTERSPTYCTPPFRKFDDAAAAESWSFLFLPDPGTPQAWERLLNRPPRCIEWSEAEVRSLAGDEKAALSREIIRKISRSALLRFRIGLDGLPHRKLAAGDSAIGILSHHELDSLLAPDGFQRVQLAAAQQAGAKIGLLLFGGQQSDVLLSPPIGGPGASTPPVTARVPVPKTGFLLDGVTRVGVKMVLNALSTCTMVRLGRVMGNTMIWVVASNLKLIDRATRYVQKLTGLAYEEANGLLFEAIDYVEPRMKADQAYPPVVGLAVMRARHGLSNEAAEARLREAIGHDRAAR